MSGLDELEKNVQRIRIIGLKQLQNRMTPLCKYASLDLEITLPESRRSLTSAFDTHRPVMMFAVKDRFSAFSGQSRFSEKAVDNECY